MPDPERIWLEPGDGAPDTGRLWCRDDVWDEPATEYVRADIHAARVAELEAHNQQLIEKLHCMCGSGMDHSAWEGHTPVSMYDYAMSQSEARVAELEAALRPMVPRLQWLVDRHGTTDDDVTMLDAARRALDGASAAPPAARSEEDSR
jgi:hypothetical protein